MTSFSTLLMYFLIIIILKEEERIVLIYEQHVAIENDRLKNFNFIIARASTEI